MNRTHENENESFTLCKTGQLALIDVCEVTWVSLCVNLVYGRGVTQSCVHEAACVHFRLVFSAISCVLTDCVFCLVSRVCVQVW